MMAAEEEEVAEDFEVLKALGLVFRQISLDSAEALPQFCGPEPSSGLGSLASQLLRLSSGDAALRQTLGSGAGLRPCSSGSLGQIINPAAAGRRRNQPSHLAYSHRTCAVPGAARFMHPGQDRC